MKKYLLIIISVFFVNSTMAQIISQFTWESNPVTQADIGPNGISVSSSATSDVNGAGGTNGLNAGLPKADINLVIPGSPTFDVPGIDISIDFQRDENNGILVSRGSSLVFEMFNGNLRVSYRVDDGLGGFITINSGNITPIPLDNTFRTYRFIYSPATGQGSVLIDGIVVWSNTGVPGRNLYWTGSGNLVVGSNMDGSGANRTIFDNLIITEITPSPLPIVLSSFSAKKLGEKHTEGVKIEWTTESEINSDFFILEKSTDCLVWEEIQRKQAQGNSNYLTQYIHVDMEAKIGNNYYRLQQFDLDGAMEIFDPIVVTFDEEESLSLNVYPNPTTNLITVELKRKVNNGKIEVVDISGKVVITPYQIDADNEIVIDISELPSGKYFLYMELDQEIKIAPIQIIR